MNWWGLAADMTTSGRPADIPYRAGLTDPAGHESLSISHIERGGRGDLRWLRNRQH
jgi:hypothetical protein